MREFSIKTQSLWYLSTELGLLLSLITSLRLLEVLNFTIPIDKVLFYSGILFAIGAGLGFGALEGAERKLFWKYKLVWLILVLFGLGLSLNGLLLYVNESALWVVTFLTGLLILLYGVILFFASMSDENRESFWKLWPIYLLSSFVSFLLGFLGFVLFFLGNGGKNPVLPSWSWEFFLSLAALIGVFGYIPIAYCVGSIESAKEKLSKLNILWLLFTLSGLVIFALGAIEILFEVDAIAVGGQSHREAALLIGLAFQVPGFIFFVISTGKEDLFRKLGPMFFLLLLAGFALALVSEFVTSLPVSTLGLGSALVVISAGGIYKAISLDYVPESLGVPSRQIRTTPSSTGSKINLQQSNFDISSDMSTDEKIFLIDLQKRTNENTMQLLNNASKSNKLSKEFVVKLVGDLAQTNKSFESEIVSIKEQAKVRSRKSIFEQAIGSDQSSSTPTPSASVPPPSVTPTPSPSTPSAPPSPPSGPPMPPGPSTPSASPSPPPGPPMPPGPITPSTSPSPPPGPPMPPGPSTPSASPSPPPGPPMPPGPSTPSAPPSPPGVSSPPPSPLPGPGAPQSSPNAPARSTSIAELRGEMLKELRRLRDIFNEDEK